MDIDEQPRLESHDFMTNRPVGIWNPEVGCRRAADEPREDRSATTEAGSANGCPSRRNPREEIPWAAVRSSNDV